MSITARNLLDAITNVHKNSDVGLPRDTLSKHVSLIQTSDAR